MKIKKTRVGTTSSSLAKVVLLKVSAAAHRSHHPEPVKLFIVLRGVVFALAGRLPSFLTRVAGASFESVLVC